MSVLCDSRVRQDAHQQPRSSRACILLGPGLGASATRHGFRGDRPWNRPRTQQMPQGGLWGKTVRRPTHPLPGLSSVCAHEEAPGAAAVGSSPWCRGRKAARTQNPEPSEGRCLAHTELSALQLFFQGPGRKQGTAEGRHDASECATFCPGSGTGREQRPREGTIHLKSRMLRRALCPSHQEGKDDASAPKVRSISDLHLMSGARKSHVRQLACEGVSCDERGGPPTPTSRLTL